MRVNSSSRSRIEATSRPISASVSNASASRRLRSNSRAFTSATATCAANCVAIATSRGVNWSRLRLRMLSAPIGRDLWINGTTSSDCMPGTVST